MTFLFSTVGHQDLLQITRTLITRNSEQHFTRCTQQYATNEQTQKYNKVYWLKSSQQIYIYGHKCSLLIHTGFHAPTHPREHQRENLNFSLFLYCQRNTSTRPIAEHSLNIRKPTIGFCFTATWFATKASSRLPTLATWRPTSHTKRRPFSFHLNW